MGLHLCIQVVEEVRTGEVLVAEQIEFVWAGLKGISQCIGIHINVAPVELMQ